MNNDDNVHAPRARVPRRRARSAVLAALVLAACDGMPDEASVDETYESPLATGFKGTDGRFLTPWASPGTINVCFLTKRNTNGTAGTPPAALVTNITTAVQRTWQVATGISFTFQGTCPATIASDWISVFIDNDGSYYNPVAAMAGKGQRLNQAGVGMTEWAKLGPQIENRTDVQVYLPDNGQDWNLKTAHEFGHALGYYHEMERGNNSTMCMNNPSGNTYGWLTPYDPDSIMLWSYCNTPNHASDHPLTRYDVLGGEMLYPRRYTGERLSCWSGCFETADGVVVATSGSFAIDWVRRGANVPFIGAPVYTYGGSNHNPSNGVVSATGLSSGKTSVTMSFNDGYKRQHTGAGTVNKSGSAYAAVFAAL